MSRAPDQIAPEVFGTTIYNLLARISTLMAEVEKLQERLAKIQAPPELKKSPAEKKS